MNRYPRIPSRTVFLSLRFASLAVGGSLAIALAGLFGSIGVQIGLLGAISSALVGLFAAYLEQAEIREQRQLEMLKQLSVPVALAADPGLSAQYAGFGAALSELAMQDDPILREIGILKAAALGQEISFLAEGTVVFTGTESWRTIYEKLLRCDDIREYQSVAWVRTKDYWQDQPGQQSLALNFEAVRRGLLIERILILSDELWPWEEELPTEEIRPWIEQQHNSGLWVSLIRESALANEQDLVVDMGLYGTRAVGVQELDEHCRTVRFTLNFGSDEVRVARDRWERLLLFAKPYRELLDSIDED